MNKIVWVLINAVTVHANFKFPTSRLTRSYEWAVREGSLGFEAEVNGDRNVRGDGLAVPRSWFVLVFLQGFHRGTAQ